MVQNTADDENLLVRDQPEHEVQKVVDLLLSSKGGIVMTEKGSIAIGSLESLVTAMTHGVVCIGDSIDTELTSNGDFGFKKHLIERIERGHAHGV